LFFFSFKKTLKTRKKRISKHQNKNNNEPNVNYSNLKIERNKTPIIKKRNSILQIRLIIMDEKKKEQKIRNLSLLAQLEFTIENQFC